MPNWDEEIRETVLERWEKMGKIIPTAFLRLPNGKVIAVMFGVGKRAWPIVLRETVKKTQATELMLVFEAWMRTGGPNEKLPQQLRDDPRAEDGLVAAWSSPGKSTIWVAKKGSFSWENFPSEAFNRLTEGVWE